MIATPETLRTEQEILAHVETGRGRCEAIVAPAAMILASPDRTITVQGVAGTGKSTKLAAAARLVQAEGRLILDLAFQNKTVADLAKGAGITAQTAASFLAVKERLVARAALAGNILVVDETSMLSSRQMLGLHRVVEAMGIDKLVLVGDRQQLSLIEAGKVFATILAGGGAVRAWI